LWPDIGTACVLRELKLFSSQRLRAFHAEQNAIKRDEIAARRAHALKNYQPSRAKKLRLSDIKEMFGQSFSSSDVG
jgi:hypothetical protein